MKKTSNKNVVRKIKVTKRKRGSQKDRRRNRGVVSRSIKSSKCLLERVSAR